MHDYYQLLKLVSDRYLASKHESIQLLHSETHYPSKLRLPSSTPGFLFKSGDFSLVVYDFPSYSIYFNDYDGKTPHISIKNANESEYSKKLKFIFQFIKENYD